MAAKVIYVNNMSGRGEDERVEGSQQLVSTGKICTTVFNTHKTHMLCYIAI
jgi:hypothetical protein